MVAEQWPVLPAWIKASVQSKGDTIWANDNSTVALLTDGFEHHFKSRLIQTSKPTAYTKWYEATLASLEENEKLSFYADYFDKHQHLLDSAPGYGR